MEIYAFNHKDLLKMQMEDRARMNDMNENAPDEMSSVLDGMQEQEDEYNKEQGIDEANNLNAEDNAKAEQDPPLNAAWVQSFYQATWSGQATNISASDETGGFNLGYTATSTGNSYSMFVSKSSAQNDYSVLESLFGNNQESNGWVNTALTISKYTDDALVLNEGIIYGSQKLANSLTKASSQIITKVPVLDVIGDVIGVASIAEHSIKFYNLMKKVKYLEE